MTELEEYVTWKEQHGFRAERAGWTLQRLTNGWALFPFDSNPATVRAKFGNQLEVWAYVLKYSATQPACRSALEFIAKWRPEFFIRAVENSQLKVTPDWLELLLITAELRQ